MHPGPVIRDIDVHSALVSRHPQSRILQQVENGMAIRKALLWLLVDRCDGKRNHICVFNHHIWVLYYYKWSSRHPKHAVDDKLDVLVVDGVVAKIDEELPTPLMK